METESKSTADTQTCGCADTKNKLSRCIEYIKEHSLHLYLGATLCVLYCMSAYEDHILQWYNEYIVDEYLSQIESNWALMALVALLVVICIYDIYQKHRSVYRYDTRLIFLIALSLAIIIWYYHSELYEYLRLWEGGAPYICILSVVGLLYVLSSLWNWLKRICRKKGGLAHVVLSPLWNWYKRRLRKKDRLAYVLSSLRSWLKRICRKKDRRASIAEPQEDDLSILHDEPITCQGEDALGLGEEVKKIAKEIRGLDRNRTWSFAITAGWGVGKTSFMNLVVGHLQADEFAIIRFNPRASRSVGTIQEDFFHQLSSTLARYDSRCGRTIRDYMASLQLIDGRGVLETAVSFYRMWDKEDLKERIGKAIGNIGPRVLVLIDDFDRLSRDEILEVLKLIDNNAAFPNLIFLTAYDKTQVNKYFGDDYQTPDACFVDKFFCLQYAIPPRPYDYIIKFVEACKGIGEAEKRALRDVLGRFREYVPTLRDAKRFLNQFAHDYEQVRGDVIVEEFVTIQLVKYRYPEYYRRIYRGEFFTSILIADDRGNFDSSYHLRGDVSKELNIWPVLNSLFPQEEEEVRGDYYLHIYSGKSFENYFVNQIYASLRIGEMDKVFQLEEASALRLVDDWLEDQKKIEDIVWYLDSFDGSKFTSDQYLRHAIVIAYIAVKQPYDDAVRRLCRLIIESDVGDYSKRRGLDVEAYKQSIVDIVTNKEYDRDLVLLTDLYCTIRRKEIDEKELLIKGDDLWPVIKDEFLRRIDAHEFGGRSELDWLYTCIDCRDEDLNENILDEDCLSAYRAYINKYPEQYVLHFVIPWSDPHSPSVGSVGCEPYWEQIFGDEDGFEGFVENCEARNIAGIDLVRNFWALYKANRMERIFFVGQGRVQDKIDAKLVEEVAMLKRLEEIQSQLDTHSDQSTALLEGLQEELEAIPLDISLRRELEERIRQLRASRSNR